MAYFSRGVQYSKFEVVAAQTPRSDGTSAALKTKVTAT